MSGRRRGNRRGTRRLKTDTQNTDSNDSAEIENDGDSNAVVTTMEEASAPSWLRAELANLAAGLNQRLDKLEQGQENMRRDFTAFGEDLKKEMREKFASYRKEIDRELEEQGGEVARQKNALAETRSRVSELEDWRVGAGEALRIVVEQVEQLQEKLLDTMTRSRRNNIRVFNCPEDSEQGTTVIEYIDRLFHTHLELPDGTQLQIQRAHRALSKKPTDPLAVPRSIVVNFLSFETKQMVLTKAWEAKIQMGDRKLGFDHDYPYEIVQRRKEYIPYKKLLKAKGIPFKTPFTKMRIGWPEGEKTYNTAEDVDAAMRKRGYSLENVDRRRDVSAVATEEVMAAATENERERERPREDLREARDSLREVSEWARVVSKKARTSMRARNKLQKFKS